MDKTIVRVADLRQQVYDALKERITGGAFPPDYKFQEINLAQDLGVSRTPVREALAMLVRDGLLEQMARGFRMRQFTADEIIDIAEIRLRLEPYAIERIIREGTPEAMATLGQWVIQTIEAAGDTNGYVDAHRKVRQKIYSHLRNRPLAEAIAHYEDSVHYVRISTLRESQYRRISYEGMLKLGAAIANSEADLARSLMEQQLINARQAFLEFAARQDEQAP